MDTKSPKTTGLKGLDLEIELKKLGSLVARTMSDLDWLKSEQIRVGAALKVRSEAGDDVFRKEINVLQEAIGKLKESLVVEADDPTAEPSARLKQIEVDIHYVAQSQDALSRKRSQKGEEIARLERSLKQAESDPWTKAVELYDHIGERTEMSEDSINQWEEFGELITKNVADLEGTENLKEGIDVLKAEYEKFVVERGKLDGQYAKLLTDRDEARKSFEKVRVKLVELRTANQEIRNEIIDKKNKLAVNRTVLADREKARETLGLELRSIKTCIIEREKTLSELSANVDRLHICRKEPSHAGSQNREGSADTDRG